MHKNNISFHAMIVKLNHVRNYQIYHQHLDSCMTLRITTVCTTKESVTRLFNHHHFYITWKYFSVFSTKLSDVDRLIWSESYFWYIFYQVIQLWLSFVNNNQLLVKDVCTWLMNINECIFWRNRNSFILRYKKVKLVCTLRLKSGENI